MVIFTPTPPFQERTIWVWAIGQCLKVIECTLAASNTESFYPLGSLNSSVLLDGL